MTHLTMEQGLPTNYIYSVIQDRNGYIWMATDNGVVRYNGYGLRIFNTDNGLPKNDVWKLYEDKRGRIWLMNHTYKPGYIEDDVFHRVVLSDKKAHIIFKFFAERDSTILLQYTADGIEHLAIIKDTVVRIFSVF